MHVYTDVTKGRTRYTEAANKDPAVIVLPEPDAGDYYHIDWIMWSFNPVTKHGIFKIFDSTTNTLLTELRLGSDASSSFQLISFNEKGFAGPTSSGLVFELSSTDATAKTLTLQFR